MRSWLVLMILSSGLGFSSCLVWAEPATGCDPTGLQGQAFTSCLSAAEKTSGQALDEAMQNAFKSIETQSGVYDTQRIRWRNQLAESQADWVRFRNSECQNVAPFEGQAASTSVLRNRVAAFEAKMICTIRMNTARTIDLSSRYPK